MIALLETLEGSWPAQFVANSVWGFPALEIVHLSGLTLVFGGMVLIDFRLLGVRKDYSVARLEQYVLPFVWGGFAVAAFSGSWLFTFEARTLAGDQPFILKMLLIAIAGLNALFMHKVGMRNAAAWDRGARSPLLVQLSALVSLGIWLSVLACGRLIAYFYPAPLG